MGVVVRRHYTYDIYIFLLSSLPKCELWMVAVLSVEAILTVWAVVLLWGVGGLGVGGEDMGTRTYLHICIFHKYLQQN